MLKKKVRTTEISDLELHRLVMKRYAVKSAQSSGLRSSKSPAGAILRFLFSEPKSQRTPSKQRELSFDVIPALVNFMPKLANYAPPIKEPADDNISSISGAESESDATDDD